MTTPQEWEQEFDLMYNSINSNLAPALDTYEKSVFLTRAQESVVRSLYSGGLYGSDSFETTELLRRSLDSLVRDKVYPSSTSTGITSLGGRKFHLDDEVLYITYEELLNEKTDACGNKSVLSVVPTTQDVYFKTKNNPFRGANERRALRLDCGERDVEIITNLTDYNYYMRYLKKPYPIILEPLTNGDLIDGRTLPIGYDPTTSVTSYVCELDDALHSTILNAAVALAAAASQQ